MMQRHRDPQLVERIEHDLKQYQTSDEPETVLWMIKKANENGYHYDLDTIDDLLQLFHHPHGAAMAIFDELYPLTAEEERTLCNARRQYMKQMGIPS